MAQKLISLVIPVYNEAANIPLLYEEITRHTKSLPYDFEIVFVDDGSSDDSVAVIRQETAGDVSVRLIELARNFGKEAAVSAGLQHARGAAALVLDADLQMPPRLMGEFLERWEAGSEVVVGVFASRNMSTFKRWGAQTFYKIMQVIGNTKITPNATDFRLLDRQVIDAFNDLTEHNRITRGMIDWLGFKRAYVPFKQEARRHGQPTYSYKKLIALAMNSFTAYSLLPLKLAGYLGACILLISVPAGIFMYVERYILNDPLQLGITGTDMLAVLTLFLIGVVLGCLGLVSLYIAHIHAEVVNRPLYVVRKKPRRVTRQAQLGDLQTSTVQPTPATEGAAQG